MLACRVPCTHCGEQMIEAGERVVTVVVVDIRNPDTPCSVTFRWQDSDKSNQEGFPPSWRSQDAPHHVRVGCSSDHGKFNSYLIRLDVQRESDRVIDSVSARDRETAWLQAAGWALGGKPEGDLYNLISIEP